MRPFQEVVSCINTDTYGLQGWHKNSIHPQYLDTLPSQVFEPTWRGPIETNGFMSGLALAWDRVLDDLCDESVQPKQKTRVLHMLLPLMAALDSDISEDEATLRLIEVIKQKNITSEICPFIISFYEMNEKENRERKFRDEKVIDSLVKHFKVHRRNLDYTSYAIQLLNLAVGESLYTSKNRAASSSHLFSLLINQQEGVVFLLEKIKDKAVTFVEILQYILQDSHYNSRLARKGILQLVILGETWHNFHQPESSIKKEVPTLVFAETLHRMMTLLYNYNHQLFQLFIAMLSHCSFLNRPELKSVLSYHFLALYSIMKSSGSQLAVQVQNLWRSKLSSARVEHKYLHQAPNFINISQESALSLNSQEDTRSLSNELEFLMKPTSKKYGSRDNIRKLWTRVQDIDTEAMRCHFEKVYLLLPSLTAFYEKECVGTEGGNHMKEMANFVIRLIKAVHSRLKKGSLAEAVLWQLRSIQQMCCWGEIDYKPRLDDLSPFMNCLDVSDQLNVKALIGFHIDNSSTESLSTLYQLYLLSCSQKENSNINRESLVQSPFLNKLRSWLKSSHGVKYSAQYLSLIEIESETVLFNLTANQLYQLLRLVRFQEPVMKKLTEFRKLINSHFTQALQKIQTNKVSEQTFGQQQQQRLDYQSQDQNKKEYDSTTVTILSLHRVMEQMWSTSYQFKNRLNDQGVNVPHKYFHWMSKESEDFQFLRLSRLYYHYNYLQEAAYYLQLHSKTLEQPSLEIKQDMTNIYQRLYPSLRNNSKHVNNCLKLTQGSNKYQQSAESLQNILQINDRIMSKPKKLRNLYDQEETALRKWKLTHLPILKSSIMEITRRQESLELREHLLRYNVLSHVASMSHQPTPPHRREIQALLRASRELQNKTDQLSLLKWLMTIFDEGLFDLVQREYFEQLLKSGQHVELKQALLQGLGPDQSQSHLPPQRLWYLICMYFEEGQYKLTMSMMSALRKKQEDKSKAAAMLRMELQCKFNVMLDFTMVECLSMVNSFTEASSRIQADLVPDLLRIFRMVFERYTFSKESDNKLFIKVYHNLLMKLPVDFPQTNPESYKQLVFYLLRFVLQKFHLIQKGPNWHQNILTLLQSKTQPLIPFCDYLLKRLTENDQKRAIVQQLILQTILDHPQQCVWTIAFLWSFSVKAATRKSASANTSPSKEEIESAIMTQLYKRYEAKAKTNENINQQLKWIKSLTDCASLPKATDRISAGSKIKSEQVPPNLPFLFQPQFTIEKITLVKNLANGKSAPLQLDFSLSKAGERGKNFSSAKIIIKPTHGTEKYLVERDTANFFAASGLIDSESTYHIHMMSRYLVAIEYIDNIGTVNKILDSDFEELTRMERQLKEKHYKRMEGVPKQQQDHRLLDYFDQNHKEIVIPFSRSLIRRTQSIKEWFRVQSNFVRTHAQWSFLGYVVGLGDRHCDNILLRSDGRLVHIDFEYVLDYGFKLPVPEVVPFRLTQSFVEPLGVLGPFGLFYAQILEIANKLKNEDEQFWQALSHFLGFADRNVPNQILQRARFRNLPKAESQEKAVAQLIREACHPQLLRTMFVGWGACK